MKEILMTALSCIFTQLFLLAHEETTAGHPFPPLHPIFVNLTAGLFPASVLFDLLGRWLNRPSLRAAGGWTMLLVAIVTPLTALFGWLWLPSMGGMEGRLVD